MTPELQRLVLFRLFVPTLLAAATAAACTADVTADHRGVATCTDTGFGIAMVSPNCFFINKLLMQESLDSPSPQAVPVEVFTIIFTNS